MTTSPRGFSWGPLSFESNALFTDVVVIVRRQARAVNSRNHRLIKALLGFPWRWPCGGRAGGGERGAGSGERGAGEARGWRASAGGYHVSVFSTGPGP